MTLTTWSFVSAMVRPTFLVAEPEPEQALSARKLVIETAKFNVITAHSEHEAIELLEKFPAVHAVIVHSEIKDFENIVEHARERGNRLPTILLSARKGMQNLAVDHQLSSHEPQQLVDLLRNLFGDPRVIDGK